MKKSTLQLEQERVNKLQEMGSYLRQLRQDQGMSLEEVAAKTKIQMRLLNAIEAGDLEQLPEPVYIQGFIKQFADALGINGAAFASSFPTTPILRPIQQPWRNLPAAQLRPVHLYVVYVCLIVFAVNSLSYLMNRSGTSTISNIEAYQPPGTQTGQAANPVVANQAFGPFSPVKAPAQGKIKPATSGLAGLLTMPQNANDSGKPVRVSVTFKAQSWIRVVTDGKTEFEGVLPEGTQRTWMADEQLTLRAGNAGGVLVGLNDQQAKQLGDPGSVEEVTFEANTNAAQLSPGAPGAEPNNLTPTVLPVPSDRVAIR
ncbi:helix-turn-helix domain-containing protein [Trichocoleus sp. FACHB-591]|uniref:helix-turn-helix domain-containing protein n=1 Tax=Trichocoleus sp. FACHB-591 TaxID=2692872 RepID=UPI0016857EAE|nr:helix-turn-helix domain-containing protein [Trichocoleus sp. FACHB-591]MBD2095203.1 helix-turn-helix domain-containing protein [Trichocoleus sp. FACHB-591]